MLIQRLEDGGLRLVPQHEHGLLSGELAAAWRGPDGDAPLPEEVVLAAALHDLAWTELDAEPRRDPETGEPLDFLSFPSGPKYEAASDAIERVSELHPYAGVLVSLHYTSFGSPGRPADFEEVEEERRLELLAELGDDAPGPAGIRLDLAYLRLFDTLSLFLCLTPPGADPSSRPDWLTPERLAAPDGDRTLALSWEGEARAVVAPDVFGGEALEVELACRRLPEARYGSDGELAAAWDAAPEERWRLRVEGRG